MEKITGLRTWCVFFPMTKSWLLWESLCQPTLECLEIRSSALWKGPLSPLLRCLEHLKIPLHLCKAEDLCLTSNYLWSGVVRTPKRWRFLPTDDDGDWMRWWDDEDVFGVPKIRCSFDGKKGKLNLETSNVLGDLQVQHWKSSSSRWSTKNNTSFRGEKFPSDFHQMKPSTKSNHFNEF